MGDPFATFADTAPDLPAQDAAAALPDDLSALADAPEVSEAGQQAVPLPDPTPIVQQQTPRLPMPVTPPMPGSPLQTDPRAKLIAIAALGAALGGGAQSGVGIGALHGALQSIADKHQADVQQWKFQAQETEKQQLATQTQQAELDRQNASKLQQTFAQIRADISTAKDEDDYRKKIGTWTGLLQLDGYRFQPTDVMAKFPFTPPQDDDLIKQKVADYFKNPIIAELVKTNPQAAYGGAISYQRNGQTVRLSIKDALSRIGQDLPTPGPDGQPLFNPIGTGTDAAQALKRAAQEFTTQFGRSPQAGNAKDNDWITERAHQFTDKKDPTQKAIDDLRLKNEQLEIQKRQYDLAHPPQADKLTRVEHKDSSTGKTVIEWIPQSQLAGRTFEKGNSMTVENRLDSAQAVQQTGNDIIAKLSDPAYASKLGPVLGRYSSLRDFYGNPPPEYAELAGQIESYGLASMGVHGMRSAQGAEQVKRMLDGHHTPQSIIAAIKGLNAFSNHFMQNEGRPTTGPPAPSYLSTDPNAGQPVRKIGG